jgi:hypothetical protein
MTHISNSGAVGNANILAVVRRHHKHQRAKNPALAALVPGGGKIVANGALRAVMPTVDGGQVVYLVVPRIEWASHLEALSARVMAHLNGGATPAVTPGEIVKTAIDTAFGALSDLERFAARVTATAIAAE